MTLTPQSPANIIIESLSPAMPCIAKNVTLCQGTITHQGEWWVARVYTIPITGSSLKILNYTIIQNHFAIKYYTEQSCGSQHVEDCPSTAMSFVSISLLGSIAIGFPLFGFFFAIAWSILFDFEAANRTVCHVSPFTRPY